MTTLTNEEILEAAKEAGLYMTSPERIAAVERLVAIIERKTIERCEHLAYWSDKSMSGTDIAAAIRKLGDE